MFGRRVDTNEIAHMPAKAAWLGGRIPDHHRSWDEVKEALTWAEQDVVVASTDFAAPYAVVARQGSNLVPRVLLAVERQNATLLGVPVGQVAIQSDRSSPEREPWRDLDSLTGVVETQFIRRMLLGESLLPFALRGQRLAVIPVADGKVLEARRSV